METPIVVIFLIGYILIALEHPIRVNKTATALITGVVCWTLFSLAYPSPGFENTNVFSAFAAQASPDAAPHDTYLAFINQQLSHHLIQISSILFFLLGAMTIVELVDAHQGFRFITNAIRTTSLTRLLWIVSWITFFLSAILDNLTTAIVMVSLTRKLIPVQEKRLLFAGMIIIAANAGGAWSPIGDVTTTMLWIGGQISSAAIIKGLFVPSMICLLVPLFYLSFRLKGTLEPAAPTQELQAPLKGSKTMLWVGIGSLVSVPVFKTVTHLPPFMGMMLGLGVLWVVSEMINPEMDEAERKPYTALHALTRVDIPSVLFFMGILLAVGALESMQTLHHFAGYLDHTIGDNRIIISLIGVVSAIVDNVPLVAACMGMYSLDLFPMDSMIWEYLAYCAGTGGSLLVIGSAAGVAVMGMEKIDFIWYVKRISGLAMMGYIGGAAYYLVMNSL